MTEATLSPHMIMTRFLIDRYSNQVKPAIERRDFELADVLMMDANLKLRLTRIDLEIMAYVHCGVGLLESSIAMGGILEKKEYNRLPPVQRYFEMMAAQTGLPAA